MPAPAPATIRPTASLFAAFLVAFLVAFIAISGPGLRPAQAADVPFDKWLDGVRADARAQGISEPTIAAALDGVALIPRVIELDRAQPEGTIDFETYAQRIVSAERVRLGRELLAKHRPLLEKIAESHGVQPRFIVALWGIESSFGRFLGGFPVVGSLATLAYDGRRGEFFRRELMNALKIVDEGHVSPDKMVGSWAGAMGQSQFMPSSFLLYAVDYDADGAKDIWGSLPDVFASAANFLKNLGWRDDITWGRAVRLPKDFDMALAGLETVKGLRDWQALGVRRPSGADLPRRNLASSIVLPGGEGGPAFVVYENYRTLLKWNRSFFFATTVGQLSDRIGGRE